MKQIIIRFISGLMMISTILSLNVTTYAMESQNNNAHVESDFDVNARQNNQTFGKNPFDSKNLSLTYGKDETLQDGITLYHKSYVKLGSVTLPNDDRIHRLIYKVMFCKDPYDEGIGNVKISLKFVRNGIVLSNPSYDANTGNTNRTVQAELLNLGKNQTIDIYADASTVSGTTSNGNLRKLYIFFFDVYTD